MALRFGRRAFALGAAGLWLPGCEDDQDPAPRVRTPTTQRVAIVGAGLAGLHCAYCLNASNVEVQVYEAQDRVGGRILTAREVFPELPGQSDADVLCELGAEFIGTNDACMRRLALELGITLEDMAAGLPAEFKGRRYWINGTEVPEATLLAEFEQASPRFTSALQPSGEPQMRLDNTSLAAWFSENLPTEDFQLLGSVLSSAFRCELGREPEELSALNLAALIGDPVTSSLQLFPRREARLRVSASMSSAVPGMDQFATKLQRQLQERLHLECRLTRITLRGDKYVLLFERPNGTGFETEADHVVLALPFSVLRQVDLSTLPLSRTKRTVIKELGYGTTSKLAAAFTSRTWRAARSTGELLDDTRWLWDGALDPRQTYGLLNALFGGKAGLASGSGDADTHFEALLPELKSLFPSPEPETDISKSYVRGSAVRVHWPTNPYSLGSASCYLPGQWALRGSEGRREGNLHFCGEHCSLDFQGRLEGAAETGALVAGEVIEDLDEQPSNYLSQLLKLKHLFDQPYDYEAKRDQPQQMLSILTRVQQVSDSHADFVENLLVGL